jgi:hypothetical protein
MKIRRLVVLAALFAGTVVAIPATPAFASLSLYRVNNPSVNDASSPKTASVSCTNPDDHVVGLGGRVNDNNNGDVLMTRMYTDAALSTVTVFAIEAIPTTSDWSLDAWAICAPSGSVGGLQFVETTTLPSTSDKLALTAPCPAGKIVYGGGYRVDEGSGKVAIDELNYDPNLAWVSSTAYVYDSTVGDFSLTTQAICAAPPAIHSLLSAAVTSRNSVTPKITTTGICPSGTQVAGVGGRLDGVTGDGSLDDLQPKTAQGVGEAEGREIGAYGSSWDLVTEAVCVG